MIPLRRTVTIPTLEHLSENCCEMSTPLKIQKTRIIFSFFFVFNPFTELRRSSSSTGSNLYFKTLHDDSYFESFCSCFPAVLNGAFEWCVMCSELKAGRRHIGGGLCWLPVAGMQKSSGRKGALHCASLTYLFFSPRFALPALWLNAAENWTAWQSRGGCFPWSRVWMEHIPGESCVNPSIDLVRNLPDPWNTLAD